MASLGWLQTRDLLRELVVRDIKLRYRGSIIGVFWTLLNPLAELLVLMFVFSTILRINIPNYPAYLFIGLLVYGWFQTSLNFATAAVVGNRELVRRPGVPSAILPVVTVASNLVHFLLSLPILFGLLILNDVPISGSIALLPGLIAIEFALILGFAYPVAIVNVWFRDTQHLLRIGLQLLFYVTPIVYLADAVPDNLRWIHRYNPLAHLIEAYRAVLMRGALPDAVSLAGVLLVALTLLGLGLWWFRHASHRFADEL